jgi:hypothetical protein
MADDTVLMPDSLQGSPAGGESAAQTRATVTETAPDTDSPDETGNQDDAGDKTAKRISDTDAALKLKQRELHEITMQLAAQKAVQEAMQRERGDGKKKDAEAEGDPFAYLDAEDGDAEVDAQPGRGVRSVLKNHTATMFKVLESRDAHLIKTMRAMLEESTNPERVELKDTLAELSQKPWFAALPKDQQLAAAKEWKSIQSGKTETIAPHTSSPGGTGRRVSASGKTASEMREEEAKAKARAIFGAQKDGDEDLYLMGKPTAKGK